MLLRTITINFHAPDDDALTDDDFEMLLQEMPGAAQLAHLAAEAIRKSGGGHPLPFPVTVTADDELGIEKEEV